jgi:hypothetical protein
MKLKKSHLFENGHLNDDATARYTNALLEGESSTLPEEILNHVETCGECKDKILELSTFLRNADSSPVIHNLDETPLKPRRKWYAYPMRLAAALFVAALLLSTYLFIYKDGSFLRETLFKSSTTEKSENISAKQDQQHEQKTLQQKNQGSVDAVVHTEKKAVTKKNNHLPPDNFRVNPNLESMIGTQYRSVTTQIISPRNNSTLSGDIVFAWKKTSQGPPPLTLKIINNKNEVCYHYSVKGNRFIFKQKLTPGLYYWKLENRMDLLYLGKFFIRSNSK